MEPPDLDDLDRWADAPGLYEDADGCWEIAGRATFSDRVGPWTRQGTATLDGIWLGGRWAHARWIVGPVTYDTANGARPAVFEDRPVEISLWTGHDGLPEDSRRGRRVARRLDRIGARGLVVTTEAAWDGSAVQLRTSWPIGGGARLDRVATFPGGGTTPTAERWTLDGTRVFPGAPWSPGVRLEALDVTLEGDEVPRREQVRTVVRKVGLAVEHVHDVIFTDARPCDAR